MKKKLILLFLVSFFITLASFSQGLMCDVDFGCWIADWSPTLPPAGYDHATTPATIPMFARSSWTDGRPCPINWDLQIKGFTFNTDDCYINGCHQHSRVYNSSDYQHMVASTGGIRGGSDTFNSSIQKENNAFFTFDIGKPEASGTLYLLVRASIPPGCIRSKILEYNLGWAFENNDPNSDWIFTTITLPYHIYGLIELPDGTDYLKSSNLANHVNNQFYATPEMMAKLQNLATRIRTEYKEGTTYDVKISFNDLSLEYGGIFDYRSTWDPPHKLHREGKSADLNTTTCLQCDAGQEGCSNKSSLDRITLRYDDGTTETLTVKEWIDSIARGSDFRLYEWERGSLIHLDLVPTP
ncbi:MAG: hypothetical protein ACE14Q_08160 [Acidobacteriota bacterium]